MSSEQHEEFTTHQNVPNIFNVGDTLTETGSGQTSVLKRVFR